VNPYWIEDRDLLNGKRDFLSGHEDKFWKDLIEKYLAPLEKDEKKEKKNAQDLITLRNKSVFSVFMLNALFVLVVFMLQTEKDMIGIEWPLEKSIKYAIFYEDNEMVSKQKLFEIKAVEGLGTIKITASN
jgi:chitin synthase